MTEPLQPEQVVQDTLGEAWDLFQNDFVLYILAGLVTIAVSLVSLGLLSGVVCVGFIKLVETRRRGEDGFPTDVFDGFSQFGECFVASILIGLGILIGMLLFVLPGLLFGLAMLFTYPAIAIDNESATGGMAKTGGCPTFRASRNGTKKAHGKARTDRLRSVRKGELERLAVTLSTENRGVEESESRRKTPRLSDSPILRLRTSFMPKARCTELHSKTL